MAKGDLQILISATYPLDQAAAAHHDLETGHIRGKIVLTTGPGYAGYETSPVSEPVTARRRTETVRVLSGGRVP